MSTGPLKPPSVGESGEALAPIAPQHLAWPTHFDTAADVEEAWARSLAARPAPDRRTLERADAFARDRHSGQMRRGSATPYWLHPVRVAMGLMQWGITDRDVLVAALLHDVVEDTVTTPEDVRGAFGARAENLVVWLTAPDGRMGDAVHSYYRRLLEQGPPDAHLIKIADRSDNLRSIQALVMRTGDEHRRWAAAYLNRTQWQVLPLVAGAPSRARVALVTAMADLAPMVEPSGFTES
jgi:(p)ppGpp synthase/HD superfamily hydrolase